MFSALTYYDRVGHIIILQSTKQRNSSRPKYSYTLFDALGRIVETGQKIENKDTANMFNKIFGDTIMGLYNPNSISNTKYLAWIKDSSGPRLEVTHNYFDVQDILPTEVFAQQQLRNRLAAITYRDTLRKDSTILNSATYFSYDVGIGNISTVIQDDSVTSVIGQRYKRLDYSFDLPSGNISEVDYQKDHIDQYHQRYQYDADNRITQVQTSKDSILWDNDANYFYYAHLPLARLELGDQQVQGIDYAYSLNGFLKGVNSDLVDTNRDMGHDGLNQSGNLNKLFATDAMGYTLKYFRGEVSTGSYGDYDAINSTMWNDNISRFEARDYNSDLMNSRHDAYNSNVTAGVISMKKPQEYSKASPTQKPTVLPLGTAYSYDQLNRLVDSKGYSNLDTDNIWQKGSTYTGLYHDLFEYDANGNILKQNRADSLGETFDSLTYQYNIQGGRTLQNRLYQINDSVNISGIHYDIKDQGTFHTNQGTINQKNNYRYTAIGELARDSSAGLDTIIWTVYGKVWKVKKHNGDSILFSYDPLHNCIEKEYKPATGNPTSTYYIRDNKQNIIAIYEKKVIDSALSYQLVERDIYGKNRIGSEHTTLQMIGAPPYSSIDTSSRYLGLKYYELNNHLDNVLVIISDRKIPRPNSSQAMIDHYEADILGANDYYGYGMLLPGRNFNSEVYRYAYNNKLKVDDIYGNGDLYDYGNRFYDPRIGRFLSTDPIFKKYPGLSPYQYASLNPISNIDLEGLEGGLHLGPVTVEATDPNSTTGIVIGALSGVGKALTGMVSDLVNVVAHPVQFLQNIAPTPFSQSSLTRPAAMADAYNSVVSTMKHGTKEAKAETMAQIGTYVATFFYGGEEGTMGKAGESGFVEADVSKMADNTTTIPASGKATSFIKSADPIVAVGESGAQFTKSDLTELLKPAEDDQITLYRGVTKTGDEQKTMFLSTDEEYAASYSTTGKTESYTISRSGYNLLRQEGLIGEKTGIKLGQTTGGKPESFASNAAVKQAIKDNKNTTSP